MSLSEALRSHQSDFESLVDRVLCSLPASGQPSHGSVDRWRWERYSGAVRAVDSRDQLIRHNEARSERGTERREPETLRFEHCSVGHFVGPTHQTLNLPPSQSAMLSLVAPVEMREGTPQSMSAMMDSRRPGPFKAINPIEYRPGSIYLILIQPGNRLTSN